MLIWYARSIWRFLCKVPNTKGIIEEGKKKALKKRSIEITGTLLSTISARPLFTVRDVMSSILTLVYCVQFA